MTRLAFAVLLMAAVSRCGASVAPEAPRYCPGAFPDGTPEADVRAAYGTEPCEEEGAREWLLRLTWCECKSGVVLWQGRVTSEVPRS